MQPANELTFEVRWSEEDREYVGLCKELPGLSWLAKRKKAALRGIRRVAREGLELLAESEAGRPTEG
jgi:hypothetical protein